MQHAPLQLLEQDVAELWLKKIEDLAVQSELLFPEGILGWDLDMKTMMIYGRKAGVDIKGISNVLSDLHNPPFEPGKVLKMGSRSDL